MTLPNFILIGAMKAGTTALYHYLGQHPEIYMSPKKEPQFFAYEGWRPDTFQSQTDAPDPEVRGRLEPHMVSEWDDYRALFSGVDGETAIGEASTHYLPYPALSIGFATTSLTYACWPCCATRRTGPIPAFSICAASKRNRSKNLPPPLHRKTNESGRTGI